MRWKLGLVSILLLVMICLTATLWPKSELRPQTVEEKIAIVEGITYEEEAPYLDARFVFKPDGRAWHCEPNNYERLKGTTPYPRYNIWIAEVATGDPATMIPVPINTVFHARNLLPPQVGDSPWGIFSVPEIKERMEPLFDAAKAEIIERLKEKEQQRLEGIEERPSASPG